MDMGSRRQTQVSELIAHLAGEFLERESNHQSLITVTRADVSPDLKNVTVYFSVLPEKFEKPALLFTKRIRTDFREFLKKKSQMKFLPTVDFELDVGEKHRQKIDELLRRS
jgi:ribosome-binding factor A